MRFRDRLQRFFYGRYGSDELNRLLLILAVILMVLSGIFQNAICSYASILLLIFTYIRMFSKNIPRRYEENQKYLTFRNKIKNFFRIKWTHLRQSRDYHFYSCPNCRQKVRVPRHRGKIEITCPKCRERFIRRS